MEYKKTLRLPATGFPMRAELARREPLWLEAWNRAGVYNRLQKERAGSPVFRFHYGPPFANGDAHIGHVLSFTLKDIVTRSRHMMGFRVPVIPGWDCHGLPIEHRVMKDLGAQGGDAALIRDKSAELARTYIGVQKGQFQRLGLLADWDHPYITMDPAYEAAELRLFARLVEKGLVYQGLRPVLWSTGCRTALAEAEVEYQSKVDPSIYVRFPLTQESIQKLGLSGEVSLLIWTTTPWTLPANLAVAVGDYGQHGNGGLSYAAYATPEGQILIAIDTNVSSNLKIPHLDNLKRLQGFSYNDLIGCTYKHPFLNRTGTVLGAEFVTDDTGTGLVHIAPGHGADDYLLGKDHGLDVLSPVDDAGCLTEACGVPALVGQYVFKANPLVIDLLQEKGLLWARTDYTHDYPHCWRSKTPIVFRAVEQWFIRVDSFRQQALDEIKKVRWIPSWGEARISGAIASRPDWCISRQRSWGVPIPAFYTKNGEALLEAGIIRRFADLVEKEGTDLWFKKETAELASLLGIPAEQHDGLRKGTDTLDVWIDSGSSHASVVRNQLGFPADLYLEGSDQHRGWFNSSLSLSVMDTGTAPYRSVLTHGFIVDEQGRKYSKSSGATDSNTLIAELGADVLRLWVASQDYSNDVPFSKNIVSRVSDAYRQIRNTLRILMANLYDFHPDTDRVPVENLSGIDLLLLHRLHALVAEVRKGYEDYQFHQVYHAVNRFCAVDLSALYVDVTKDRLYCDSPASPRRRATQTVMHEILESLCLLIAPVMPYTAEEAWQYAAAPGGGSIDGQLVRDSVHLSLFPEPQATPATPDFLERWTRYLSLRDLANEQLEQLRREKTIGKNLEAAVEIESPDLDENDAAPLEELLLVSRVTVRRGKQIRVHATRAPGARCDRCWKYFENLGTDPAHPTLCPRCTEAVSAAGT
jgi:isoleucyl-tRNA synthetase